MSRTKAANTTQRELSTVPTPVNRKRCLPHPRAPWSHHTAAGREPLGNLGWSQDAPHLAVSQAPSMGHPEETQEEKRRTLAPESWGARHPVSPDSSISHIQESTKFLKKPGFLQSTVISRCSDSQVSVAKTPTYRGSGSPLASSVQSLRVTWDVVSQAYVLSFVSQTQGNSQLTGCKLSFRCQLQTGTCHLPLQGLKHELLQLLTFNTCLKGIPGREHKGGPALQEKLAEQLFRQRFPGVDFMSPILAPPHI